MIKKRFFIAGVACATIATVLTAAQLNYSDIRLNKQQMERVHPGYGANYNSADEWVVDPAEMTGDLMIRCLRIEDEEGGVRWMYESSDLAC